MNWGPYPESNPYKTGNDVVSISCPYNGGKFTFTYFAHYNAETGKWHKYDSFIDGADNVGDEIWRKILGWEEDNKTFLGFL